MAGNNPYNPQTDYNNWLAYYNTSFNDYKDYYEKIELIEFVKDDDYLYGVKVNNDYISFDC